MQERQALLAQLIETLEMERKVREEETRKAALAAEIRKKELEAAEQAKREAEAKAAEAEERARKEGTLPVMLNPLLETETSHLPALQKSRR